MTKFDFMRNIATVGSLALTLLLSIVACTEEEYDFDTLSTDSLTTTTALEAPIGKVNITVEDIFLHRSSKGTFNIGTQEYNLSDFVIGDEVPLPAYVDFSSDVTSIDSLTEVGFDDVFGEENIIDSLYGVVLNFEIYNEIPFNGVVEIRFMRDIVEEVFGEGEVSMLYEEKSLRRSIEVGASNYDPTTKKLINGTKSKASVEFDGSANEALSKITQIDMVYRLYANKSEVFLEKDYHIDIKVSAYAKARLIYAE